MASETIVAVASPPGRSPRGLIRASGPQVTDLIDTLLSRKRLEPRAPTPGRLRLSNHHALPILATLFPGPHSYTGEDVLELQLPGNPALLERVLMHLLNLPGAGVRLAEPGEFTRRAFINGRIDLTRAEGIAATIGAVSDAQLRAAGLLRQGRLGRFAEQLVDRLARLLALVEAGIDFVDQDDVVAITPGALDAELADIARQLTDLRGRCRSWSQLQSLPWVVLAGDPNAGKSTLFNALLGRERAVASSAAGTTRDVLTEPLRLDHAEVMLVDMAGLDDAAGALDRAMQAAARAAIDRAELILALGPLRIEVGATPIVRVAPKVDLGAHDEQADVHVSAVTGEGLAELRQIIAARLNDRAVAIGGEAMALQPRHEQALRSASEAIVQARRQLAPQREAADLHAPELVADTMRRALDQLAALGGEMTPDDVLGRVFATFCVGK